MAGDHKQIVVCDMCGGLLESPATDWVELSLPGTCDKLDFCSFACMELYREIEALSHAAGSTEVDDEDTNPGLGPALKN